ncbi:MAG: AraC family transcriptional regulator [Hahellaceae bacterium]|nr:AraC family transcriptional regulator [Hahellaceae bacterium]MCP5209775.1 AraC family transcriptional regulator [Hahellaceae bacterium]
MSNELLVSASSARTLVSFLEGINVTHAEMESKTGIVIADLEKPDSRIPITPYNQLWNLALLKSKDPALGLHLGEMVNEEQMGVIGHITFNNPTLGEALAQFTRLFQLVNEGMRAELIVQDELAILRYLWDAPEFYSTPNMERTMAVSITRARSYIAQQLKVEYVSFQHPQPSYIDEYNRIFNCPLKFGDDCSSIAFKSHFLDYKLPKGNPYIHQVLTRHVENLLKKLRARNSFSSQIRNLIAKELSKNAIDAETIASQMHMSRHTLYRKLKSENHSFQELVEDVRQEKAMKYLSEDKYSLSEIAFLLGFSELSAFSRAFKRWTGKSPAQFMKEKS